MEKDKLKLECVLSDDLHKLKENLEFNIEPKTLICGPNLLKKADELLIKGGMTYEHSISVKANNR